LTLLPTLNLAFDTMSPTQERLSCPPIWVLPMPGTNIRTAWRACWDRRWSAWRCDRHRLAGSPDRNRRLIAFGLFWYLIALVPVSSAFPLLLTGVEFANSPPGAASVQTFAAFDPRQPRCNQWAKTTSSVLRAPA